MVGEEEGSFAALGHQSSMPIISRMSENSSDKGSVIATDIPET